MANHTIFNDGVEVHAKHLSYESESRIADLNTNILDSSETGVELGLVVSIGASPDLIDISAGAGYANNAERMTYAGSTGLVLAAYALNAKNYVALMYSEDPSEPEAYEADGTTKTTKSEVVPRIVVLTEANWLALPVSDTIFANNALDRALLLAVVITDGSIISSIVLPDSHNQVLAISQTVNITGVSVIEIDQTTATGTGILTYVAAGNKLSWASPGDSAGPYVDVIESREYTLYSATSGRYIKVFSMYPLLPATNKSDPLAITSLYSQDVPRFSGVDSHHRSILGSGVPSDNNPHGLTIDDIDPLSDSVMQVHQLIQHSNGITTTSDANVLKCTVNTATSPDQLNVTGFAPGDTVYIKGNIINSISGASTLTFAGANYGLYVVYMNEAGVLNATYRATYTPSAFFINALQLVDCSSTATGTYAVKWTSGGRLYFADGPEMDPPATDAKVRLYSGDNTMWVDVFVKAGVSAPGTLQTLNITFYTLSLPADWVFPITHAYWNGVANGDLGYGFGTLPLNILNQVVDLRKFGTLSILRESSDSAVMTRQSAGFVFESGIVPVVSGAPFVSNEYDAVNALNDQFVPGTVSSGTVPVSGGSVLLDGRHYMVSADDVIMLNSATNRVYVKQIDDRAGLGSSDASWESLTADGSTIIRLWEIAVDGTGAETTRTDFRVGGGSYRKNVPMGVVGIDAHRTVTLTAEPSYVDGLDGYDCATLVGGAGRDGSGGPPTTGGNALKATGGVGGSFGGGAGAVGGDAIDAQGGNGGVGGGLDGEGGNALKATGGNGYNGGPALNATGGSGTNFGGTAIVAQGGNGGTHGGPALGAIGGNDYPAIIAQAGAAATESIRGIGGDIEVEDGHDFTYSATQSGRTFVLANDFSVVSFGVSAPVLNWWSETGDTVTKPRWTNTQVAVYTARINVPRLATITGCSMHINSATSGTMIGFTMEIVVSKWSATYGFTALSQNTETFSLPVGHSWAPFTALTPFTVESVGSYGGVIDLRIAMPLPSTGDLHLLGAMVQYTFDTVTPCTW